MCLFGFFGGFVSVSDTEIVFHRRPAQNTIDEIQANNNSKPAKSLVELVLKLNLTDPPELAAFRERIVSL